MLRAAAAPSAGRWHVVLFEDADRATEQAANALLKAIEEPAPRTVWLLCAPSADDLPHHDQVPVPAGHPAHPAHCGRRRGAAGARGSARTRALAAARAAQGHIGRARRLATDPQAAARRDEVLRVPPRVAGLGYALAAAATLVKAAETEAAALTEELDVPEREALRRAFGEGSTGKGVASRPRRGRCAEGTRRPAEVPGHQAEAGRAGPGPARPGRFYRDVLAVQFGADVELANAAQRRTRAGSLQPGPPRARCAGSRRS